MGCNCGGNKNAKEDHIYTDEKGKQYTYTSVYEAKAHKIRNKGLGSVRTVARKV